MAKPIPGIPDKANFGNPTTVEPGQLLTYIRQKHKAEKAGPHQDIRFGSPETGLFSWATKKDLPSPGDKPISLFQQPLHTYDYKDFSGRIPKGTYGAGTVKKTEEGKVLITKVDDNGIHLTTAHNRYPQRFVLVKPKAEGDKRWLLVNTTPKEALPFEKIKYTSVPADQAEEVLKNITPGSSVQAKIDGAAALYKLLKDRIEIASYRAAGPTGHPIIHSERVFHGKQAPINIPKPLIGSVLRGELYGTQTGKAIHPSSLGGILNSTIAKSITDQTDRNIDLKNLIFDIHQYGKKKLTQDSPYADRLARVKELVSLLPKDKFHLPEEATTPNKAVKLWKDIVAGKNPLSTEGVVIHPPTGRPIKIKQTDEHDVFIRKLFPGEGKYKDKGVGGFEYSYDKDSPIIGRVGTGLSDELRTEMLKNPAAFLGRVARVHAQEKLRSGSLRAPALIALHEDKPLAKTSYEITNPTLRLLLQAKDYSDKGMYSKKHEIIRRLMQEKPDEWYVDSSLAGNYAGVTHEPLNFKLHVPYYILPPNIAIKTSKPLVTPTLANSQPVAKPISNNVLSTLSPQATS